MKEKTRYPIAGWTQCIPIKPPTMPPTSAITSSRKRVFDSVFSPASPGAFPTADNVLPGTIDPLAAVKKPYPDNSQGTTDEDEPGPDQETWDRAWNAATAFLAVPDRGLAALGAFEDIDEGEFLKRWNRYGAPSKKTADALAYLVSQPESTAVGLGSIVNWYGREIRRHFLKNFRDDLFQVCYRPDLLVDIS